MPRFVAKDLERRDALRRGFRNWLAEHRTSMATWLRTGQATFPPGTYKMRGMPGVRIREGPPIWEM